MAGALSELTKRSFKKDFRSIKPEQSRIILVEAVDDTRKVSISSTSSTSICFTNNVIMCSMRWI
jgi:hypothetical protein